MKFEQVLIDMQRIEIEIYLKSTNISDCNLKKIVIIKYLSFIHIKFYPLIVSVFTYWKTFSSLFEKLFIQPNKEHK